MVRGTSESRVGKGGADVFEDRQRLNVQVSREIIVKEGDLMTQGTEGENTPAKPQREKKFVGNARNQLQSAVGNDGLSLFKEQWGESNECNDLKHQDISPRFLIPGEYKLQLCPTDKENTFTVHLWHANGIDLHGRRICEKEDLNFFDGEPDPEMQKCSVEALANTMVSLKCAVLAFENSCCLYQSRSIASSKGPSLITLVEVTVDVYVAPGDYLPAPDSPIIGMNPNQRYVLLEKCFAESGDSTLMFGALRDCIGCERPTKRFDCLTTPTPSSFDELNDQRRQVAHPLALTTAMEVAGPPGTGKTKTIEEFICCILLCKSAMALVLSERNGAIDAIAENFVGRCLEMRSNGISPCKRWSNVGELGVLGMFLIHVLFSLMYQDTILSF